MAEIKIAAIMRAGAYSPNHIGNDAAILNAAAEQLRKRGCLVNIYSEEQFNNQGVEENVILNMCREQKSIENLQKAEDAGKIVINSGFGIENCTRERMTRILLGNGIPYPESLIVNTDEAIKPMLKKSGFQSCWIKRGDFHAMHKEDVSFVRHPEEAQEVLQEYFLRGIKRAVINVHLEGDLVKFYGVNGIRRRPQQIWMGRGERKKSGHQVRREELQSHLPTGSQRTECGSVWWRLHRGS